MLTGFIERLLDARTVPDIRAVFLEAVQQLGFDHAAYAARFMLSVPKSLMGENPVVFSNLPTDLVAEVRMLPALERDGWIEWALTHDGDIAAQELRDQGRPSPSFALAERHGLAQARIISLRDKVLNSAGAVMVFPFNGAGHADLRDRWQRTGREVRVLSWVLHMRMATMQRHPHGAVLTPRQREVLGWRSAGKTVAEIGVILGITPATVEKHMRLAREALGVETTPQAVLKAHVTHQLVQPVRAGRPAKGSRGAGRDRNAVPR